MFTDFFKKKLPGKSLIPNILTVFRIMTAPIFFYIFLNGYPVLSLFLFIFAVFTDFLDGYIARKMNTTSNIGAYLDAIADFILIATCFLAFIIKGWYGPLILVLITVMFFLFLATSGLERPIYDPVGKYLGAYLMGMILLSLFFPEPLLRQILLILFIIFSFASIISRIIFLWRRSGN